MAVIRATVQPPTITVAWTHGGVPAGTQEATPEPVTVERNVDDPENWAAVGNWEAGQDAATITGSDGGSGEGFGGLVADDGESGDGESLCGSGGG